MKYLMSIAWRTLPYIGIEEIIEEIEMSENKEYVAGIEIATTNYEEMEKTLKYIMDNNLIFRCHCPKIGNQEVLTKYLDDLHTLAKIYGKKIDVVFHSLEFDDLEKSIEDTKEYIKNILEYIRKNNYEITISLENLNYHHNRKRININLIDKVFENLKQYPELNFTYDIGHDIYDTQKPTKLSNIQKEKLNNIHIHNIKNNEDHHIICKNCETIKELRETIKYLKEIGYKGPIVLEEGIDRYEGKNMRECVRNYIKSFKEKKEILED